MRILCLLTLVCFIGCRERHRDKESEPQELAAERAPVALPGDPASIVISLNYGNAFEHWSRPNTQYSPLLAINADGGVIAHDRYWYSKKIESKISQEQLQDLLQFAIHDNNFFQFERSKVEAAVKLKLGKKDTFTRIPSDQDVTRIYIRTLHKQHEADYYALAHDAHLLKELGQFSAVDRRLNELWNKVRADGHAAAADVIKLANQQLLREHPKVPLLGVDALHSAVLTKDGPSYASFYRASDAENDSILVEVERSAKQVPTVKVTMGFRLNKE